MRDLDTNIQGIISRFLQNPSENSLKNPENDKAWEEALVGFSNGDDPLYKFFKEDIGKFYLTPLEIFKSTFSENKIAATQLTIISWILPHNEKTKFDNRKRTVFPSERWARARIYGEQVNDKLRGHVVETLKNMGFHAIAPMLSTIWKVYKESQYGRASNWSERHTAYASGLGTFGLCDGLITPKGKAMRCGSVITDVEVQPTKRPYNNHHAYCLFFSNGNCGRCIKRCPAGAINKSGHDKNKCRNHLRKTREFVKQHYGFEGYGCGLCQTNVPCESRIPTQKDL